MRTKLLSEGDQRTLALVFDTGDEVVANLERFAQEYAIDAAHFTAIGAFDSATIALTDASKEPTRVFRATKLNEDMEISAFNGSITRNAAGLSTVPDPTV